MSIEQDAAIKRLERKLARARRARDHQKAWALHWKQAYDAAQEQLRAERRMRLRMYQSTWGGT